MFFKKASPTSEERLGALSLSPSLSDVHLQIDIQQATDKGGNFWLSSMSTMSTLDLFISVCVYDDLAAMLCTLCPSFVAPGVHVQAIGINRISFAVQCAGQVT